MNEACPFCGDSYHVGILEVYGRDFLLDTCCVDSLYDLTGDLNCDVWGDTTRLWLRAKLRRCGIPVRSIYCDGFSVRIDNGLMLTNIDFRTACRFIDRHHRHHDPPKGWRWGHGIVNGRDLVAVATVGRTVARAYDPARFVEVNRLCVRADVHPALTRHCASMLLGAAAREARRRRYATIITYILESEHGTSLRGAGWTLDGWTAGGSWNTRSRPRTDRAPTCPKQRWIRNLTR